MIYESHCDAKMTLTLCIINNKDYTDSFVADLTIPEDYACLEASLVDDSDEIAKEITEALYDFTDGEYKYVIEVLVHYTETKDYFGEIDVDMKYEYTVLEKEACDFDKEQELQKETDSKPEMSLRALLSTIGFDYTYEDGNLRLKDLTGANLGKIESETFETVEKLIDRLDNYWFDYYFPDEESPDYGKFDTLEEVMNAEGYGHYRDALYAILHPDILTVEKDPIVNHNKCEEFMDLEK